MNKHHLLSTQRWLIILITIVMGWSGFVQVHAQMLHLQMNPLNQMIYSYEEINVEKEHQSTASKENSDCHSKILKIQSEHSHQSYKTESIKNLHQHQNLTHSEPESAYSKSPCHNDQNQHVHNMCNDCIQMSCQTLVAVLNAESTVFETTHQNIENLYPHYFAQHLMGYWQEILRPPKT